MPTVLVLLLMLLCSDHAGAETSVKSILIEYESEVIAEMDGTELLVADLKAFLGRIPEDERAGVLENKNRATSIYEDLVLTRRLAGRALDRGALADEQINADLYQIIMVHLAERELEHHIEEALLDDYSDQAKELYISDSADFRTAETYSFAHLLLKPEGRTEKEVRQQLNELRAQAESGADFHALVNKYSEDPSVSRNNGQFEDIQLSQLDPAFADALVNLERSSRLISKPVKSSFGWHLIRLDDFTPGRKKAFDEVEEKLRKKARSRHREEIQQRYFKQLMPEPIRIRKEALDNLLEHLN